MLKVNQENIGDKRHLSSIQEYCFDLHHSTYQGPVAQRIRHLTTNQGIPGSNPGRIVLQVAFQDAQKWTPESSLPCELHDPEQFHRPCGLMDKASDFESEDSRFES